MDLENGFLGNPKPEGYDPDLEHLYMPYFWPSKLRADSDAQSILIDYATIVYSASSATYEKYSDTVTTLKYGENLETEQIDVITPKERPTGCLVGFVHGGYWQMGRFREMSMHMADAYLAAGHFYAGLGYLSPHEQLPLVEICHQAIRAVNKLCEWAESRADISSVVLMGHSAGAHLLSMLITSPLVNQSARSLIKGLVLSSGLYDLRPVAKTTANHPKLALEKVVSTHSPLLHIESLDGSADLRLTLDRLTRVLLLCGGDESPGFIEQSSNFYAALRSCRVLSKVDVRFHLVKDKDHMNVISDEAAGGSDITKEILTILDTLHDQTSSKL